MSVFLFSLGLLFLSGSSLTAACHTEFDISGNYSISPVDVNFWLNSGQFAFNLNGKWRSTDDGSLHVNKTNATSGTDDIGEFVENLWVLTAENITMEAAIRTYPDISIPVVVFVQRFRQGLTGSKTDDNKTVTSFPSFKVQDAAQQQLGYLSFGGLMFGDLNKKAGTWGSKAEINDGLEGSGPLVVFDGERNAMIISALDNFMAASIWQDKTKGIVNYGVMGGVDSIPANFEYRTIAYCSNTGIGDAFEGWGRIMRKVYNKTNEVTEYHQSQDLSLTHLGYWTDNGAYYYYNMEAGKNYEDTLLDVKNDGVDKKVPYTYMQLDSWFYHKDGIKAVTTWDATEEVFPFGIRAFQEKLQLPLVAHNRYWSLNTTYAKQRGGFFDFVNGKQLSLPNEQFFWEFLLGHARVEWDLVVYEQDWLNVQFLTSEFLTTDLILGRTWLQQMGAAAANRGLKIQYCMALPRHAYQSLEIPTVTQARVSNDYHSHPNQWKIGVSSHFATAMGVAPSKDTFWTTSVQPGNTYNKSEPYPTLQTVVATLSRGPVGPGDMLGGTNATTLLRCCDETGLILKPSKPARAIDDQLKEMAFANGSWIDGEVWTTHSTNAGLLYGVIMAANLTKDYVISPHRAGFLSQYAPNFTDSVVYSSENRSLASFTTTINFTIKASECSTNREPFCLLYTAPVITFGFHQVVLLGDLTKWVPMSENRVVHIWQTTSGIAATLRGKPKELISFTYAIDGVVFENTLAADDVGCATFTVISSNSNQSTPTAATTALTPTIVTTASSTTNVTAASSTTNVTAASSTANGTTSSSTANVTATSSATTAATTASSNTSAASTTAPSSTTAGTTASPYTSPTGGTATTWRPTLPPGYDCRFQPPSFTTPAPTTAKQS